jgi:ATP-binding cassette subfamily B protein
MRKDEDLPPAFASMWRLCKLGYRYEPALMGWAFVLALLAGLPDALIALWFKLMADGVAAHDTARLTFASIALGVSAAATWFLRTMSTRLQLRFRARGTNSL